MMSIETVTYPLGSAEANQVLASGWIENAVGPGTRRRAIARQVIDEVSDRGVVLFEVLDQPPARPRGLKSWLLTVRAFSLTATVTPCLAVFFWIKGQGLLIDASAVGRGIGGVLLLQVAINLLNDVEDYRKLIDLPGTLGGSGAIQKGWWTPRQLKTIGFSALLAGAALGLPSVIAHPVILAPIAALAGLGVLTYSAKNFGLKYIALGDCAVFILCGPALTLGFATSASEQVGSDHLLQLAWIGAFFGFLAMALLHVNNLQDMNLDRRRGIHTLAIGLGFKGSLQMLVGLYVLAAFSLLWAIFTGGVSPWALTGVLAIAVTAGPWLMTVTQALGPESARLSQCRIRAAQIHLMSGLALIGGLLIHMTLSHFTLR